MNPRGPHGLEVPWSAIDRDLMVVMVRFRNANVTGTYEEFVRTAVSRPLKAITEANIAPVPDQSPFIASLIAEGQKKGQKSSAKDLPGEFRKRLLLATVLGCPGHALNKAFYDAYFDSDSLKNTTFAKLIMVLYVNFTTRRYFVGSGELPELQASAPTIDCSHALKRQRKAYGDAAAAINIFNSEVNQWTSGVNELLQEGAKVKVLADVDAVLTRFDALDGGQYLLDTELPKLVTTVTSALREAPMISDRDALRAQLKAAMESSLTSRSFIPTGQARGGGGQSSNPAAAGSGGIGKRARLDNDDLFDI